MRWTVSSRASSNWWQLVILVTNQLLKQFRSLQMKGAPAHFILKRTHHFGFLSIAPIISRKSLTMSR